MRGRTDKFAEVRALLAVRELRATARWASPLWWAACLRPRFAYTALHQLRRGPSDCRGRRRGLDRRPRWNLRSSPKWFTTHPKCAKT